MIVFVCRELNNLNKWQPLMLSEIRERIARVKNSDDLDGGADVAHEEHLNSSSSRNDSGSHETIENEDVEDDLRLVQDRVDYGEDILADIMRYAEDLNNTTDNVGSSSNEDNSENQNSPERESRAQQLIEICLVGLQTQLSAKSKELPAKDRQAIKRGLAVITGE